MVSPKILQPKLPKYQPQLIWLVQKYCTDITKTSPPPPRAPALGLPPAAALRVRRGRPEAGGCSQRQSTAHRVSSVCSTLLTNCRVSGVVSFCSDRNSSLFLSGGPGPSSPLPCQLRGERKKCVSQLGGRGCSRPDAY